MQSQSPQYLAKAGPAVVSRGQHRGCNRECLALILEAKTLESARELFRIWPLPSSDPPQPADRVHAADLCRLGLSGDLAGEAFGILDRELAEIEV